MLASADNTLLVLSCVGEGHLRFHKRMLVREAALKLIGISSWDVGLCCRPLGQARQCTRVTVGEGHPAPARLVLCAKASK